MQDRFTCKTNTRHHSSKYSNIKKAYKNSEFSDSRISSSDLSGHREDDLRSCVSDFWPYKSDHSKLLSFGLKLIFYMIKRVSDF